MDSVQTLIPEGCICLSVSAKLGRVLRVLVKGLVLQLGHLPGSRTPRVCRKGGRVIHSPASSELLSSCSPVVLPYPSCRFHLGQMQLSASRDTINTELMGRITLRFATHRHTSCVCGVREENSRK